MGFLSSSLFCFLLFPFLLQSPAYVNAKAFPNPAKPSPNEASKPDPKDAAGTARWLVAQNTWGILSTISIHYGGAPFGNVVSFSDGLPGHGFGVPYFYLSEFDPTAKDALSDSRSSFTVSENPLGTCIGVDPENPTCAKLTLIGKLELLNNSSVYAKFAESALFSKHPEMKGWPIDHGFKFFKFVIEHIFLIDWFGGAKPLTVGEYLKYKVFHGMMAATI